MTAFMPAAIMPAQNANKRAVMENKPFYKSLYFQVLVAIVLGILLGYFRPDTGQAMEPLSVGFIKLIKMSIAPVIFCTVVSGIVNMESIKSVGKTGGLAILYFEIVSTLALIVGLIVVNVVEPGSNSSYVPSAAELADAASKAKANDVKSFSAFALNIIPDTILGAFARGDILQVLLVSVLFAFALHALGERGKPIREFIDHIAHVLFGIINIIVKIAPIGAFGAMAFAVGKYGIGTLWQQGKLMLCFYTTCLIFIFVVLGAIARVHRFSILKLIKYIRQELLIVLGTSSSETVLPRLIAKLEAAGCDPSTVRMVVPTGYSFNLDGTSIYLTMGVLFIAQAMHIDLSWPEQIGLLLLSLATSKGAAAVTGGGLIVLTATLVAYGKVPLEGLALVVGIDRFMSEARALTNLIGNGVATIVVAKWCKQIDENRLREQLG